MNRLTEQQIETALANVRGISATEANKLADRARNGGAHANFALSAFLKDQRTGYQQLGFLWLANTPASCGMRSCGAGMTP